MGSIRRDAVWGEVMHMNAQVLLAADLKRAGETPQQVLRQLRKHSKVDAQMEQFITTGSQEQPTGSPSAAPASRPKCGLARSI